jgi:uncharacterized membrane protein
MPCYTWARLIVLVNPHVFILLIGLLLFILPHLLREFGLRQAVIASRSSLGVYKGLYSLTAITGLMLIIWGKSLSPFIMVWQPIYELRYISHLLMLPALVLLVAGNVPATYLSKYLKNPMLLAVVFWGLAHLWSNGDLASTLLFGSFALWGSVKFVALAYSDDTASNPKSLVWDVISIIGGLGLYVGISLYHGQLFGVGLAYV